MSRLTPTPDPKVRKIQTNNTFTQPIAANHSEIVSILHCRMILNPHLISPHTPPFSH